MAQHDPQTPCPPPRWIGNLLRVLGTREADETNFYYLNNNSIPPALLMISGGTIGKKIKERLQSRIKAELEGAGKNHRILVVEASSPGKPNERTFAPTMEFKSLRDAQQGDALFTQYDTRASDSIGASFRLPPLLRGYTPSALNRATALASMYFAEQQVFQPEREKIDWIINKYIMPEIGIRYLRFESNTPPTKSVEELGELIKAAAPYGGMVPYEIRDIVGDILNKDMQKLEGEWTKVPMPMVLAGMGGGAAPAGGMEPETASELRGIEERVAHIVTTELRAAGYDLDVSARFHDAPMVDVDDDGEEEEG
jgi:capsid portal protein